MTQMVPKFYYLLRFGHSNFNSDNIIYKLLIFLQLNSYCKIIVKFLTKKKHRTMSKKVSKGNSMNKNNLE